MALREGAMVDEVKFENALGSKMDLGSAKVAANKAALMVLLGAIRSEGAKIREGGGAKAAEAQRAKGRLTVRERLALLLDPEPLQTQVSESRPGAPGVVQLQNFLELGLWAAHGMYGEYGGGARG